MMEVVLNSEVTLSGTFMATGSKSRNGDIFHHIQSTKGGARNYLALATRSEATR